MYELLVEKVAQIKSAIDDYLGKTPTNVIQGDRGLLKLTSEELIEAFSEVPVPDDYVPPVGEDSSQTTLAFEASDNPHAERNQNGTLKNEEDRKYPNEDKIDETDIDKPIEVDLDENVTSELTEPKVDEAEEQVIRAIAEKCHNANLAYCVSIGDDSQVPFDEAPENIQQSTIDGVKKYMEDPDSYTPEASHENWLKFKTEDGWTYGEEKDVEKKTHPCMVPYDELPDEQKIKDDLFVETLKEAFKIN